MPCRVCQDTGIYSKKVAFTTNLNSSSCIHSKWPNPPKSGRKQRNEKKERKGTTLAFSLSLSIYLPTSLPTYLPTLLVGAAGTASPLLQQISRWVISTCLILVGAKYFHDAELHHPYQQAVFCLVSPSHCNLTLPVTCSF